MCGEEKANSRKHDVISASDFMPFFPGNGVNTAYEGHGSLTDNYGNVLSGRELRVKCNNGDVHIYHLTESQAEELYFTELAPFAKLAGFRLDNKIPILFHMKSPIEEEAEYLVAQHTPFTIVKSKGKERK